MLRIEQVAVLIGSYGPGTLYKWRREGFLPELTAMDGKTMLWSFQSIMNFARAKRFVHAYR